MNSEHEKQMDLQKVLALKRHEAPPPRFFKGFSTQVMDRIHSPEPSVPRPWWQRFGDEIDSRPVLVCGSGIIVCGLLVIGLIASLRVEPPKRVAKPSGDPNQLIATPASPLEPAQPGTLNPNQELRVTEPVLISEPSPFSASKPTIERTAQTTPAPTPR